MQGLKALPVVAAAQIIAGIAIGMGLILLVIPGVYLALRLAVVAQVAAIERTDWPGALRRSAVLTRSNYLRILGLLMCVYAVNLTLTSAGVALAGHGKSAADVAVGIVAATLTQSFQALIAALLYFDLRVRHPPGRELDSGGETRSRALPCCQPADVRLRLAARSDGSREPELPGGARRA